MDESLRATMEWLRSQGRHRWSAEWAWPEGWSEGDSPFHVLDAPSVPLFLPGEHAELRTLREVDDLIDLLDDPVDPPHLPPDVERTDGNIDKLAWYATFRSKDRWGIFIRDVGIERVAQAVAAPGGSPDRSHRRVGLSLLYLHEYSHFLFDVAAVALEEVVGAPLYEPHRTDVTSSPPYWHPLTEALCNAFAYRTVRATGMKRRLAAFLRSSPAGYRISLATPGPPPSAKESRPSSVNSFGAPGTGPGGYSGVSIRTGPMPSVRGLCPCTSYPSQTGRLFSVSSPPWRASGRRRASTGSFGRSRRRCGKPGFPTWRRPSSPMSGPQVTSSR